MDVGENIMFDTGAGRRIEDRVKEGRIEYIDRGLGMVNISVEVEGGRESEGIKFLRLSCRF